MGKVLKKTACVLAVALCAGLCSPAALAFRGSDAGFAADHPALVAKFEETARHMMEADGIPGMSIALADDKGVLWAEGFGYTDGSHSRRVDADTIFSIQSISKTVTATAVVEAANRGLLDLGKPITDYLPDFTVNSVFEERPEKKMTLRHLLSHTAGFTHEAPVGSNFDADSRSFEAHIRSISNTWLRFPVGQDYGYSNLGVDLAGYILQKASGQSFESYVDQFLTGPAGMANSTFDMGKIRRNPNRAAGTSNGYYAVPLGIPMIPSGGFYSSANDMAKFIQHHLNNNDALAGMYQIPFSFNGQTEGYALGVGTNYDGNAVYHNHNGGGFGFSTSLTWYPQLKIGVVVLTNSSDTPAGYIWPYDLGMQILRDVLDDSSTVYHARLGQLPALAKPVVREPNLGTKLVSDVQQDLFALKDKPLPDSKRYQGYAGTYAGKFAGIPFESMILNVTEKDGALFKDGSMLTEAQPGLFVTDDGETLDLRGGAKTFRSVAIEKLPFGMAFVEAVPLIFFLFFLAAVQLAARRKHHRPSPAGRLAAAAGIVEEAGAGLYLVTIAAYAALVLLFVTITGGSGASLQTYRAVGAVILLMKIFSPLVLLASAAGTVFCVFVWVKKWWRRFDRISYTCAAAFGVLFVLYLLRMNVLVF